MHKSTTSKRKLPDTWLVVFFYIGRDCNSDVDRSLRFV